MFKTLAKISVLLILIFTLVLAGCSNEFKYSVSGGPAIEDEVTSNGGLAVKKGNYIYFVNGTASTGDNNKFGSVVKGSIVRVNLNDISDKQIIVPKVVLSSYYAQGGFYIFGDKIYYTSPSTVKNKTGSVLTSYLDFWGANLDGSGTFRIMTTVSNSKAWRFFQDGSDVYVIFIAADADSKDCIYLAKAVPDAKITLLLEDYTAPVFAGDNYVYFNKAVYKDTDGDGTIEEDETSTYGYNRLARISFKGGNIQDIALSGGTTIAANKYNITLSSVQVFDGKTTLFYTKKSASDLSEPIIWKEPFSCSYTLGEAQERIIVASTASSSSSSSTSGAFDFTSRLYDSPTSFLGVKTFGQTAYVCYVTNTYDNQNNPDINVVQIMTNPTKLLFIDGDFVYFLKAGSDDTANVLYKKKFKNVDENDVLFMPEEEVLPKVSIDTSGLLPEYIGSTLYFLRTDGDYAGYVYRADLSADEPAAELVSKVVED